MKYELKQTMLECLSAVIIIAITIISELKTPQKEQMMNRTKTLVTLLVTAIILMGFVPATGGKLQQQLAQESTLEKIIKSGTIRVGMDVFVPWAMKDKKGELIGFEIDVARQLADDMGVKVEFVPTKWSGIIPALLAGKFDIIIGGMGVTPQRNLKINFTNPYYYSNQGLLANLQKSKGFSISDFNNPDVTLVARLGSTAAIAARKNFPEAKLLLFDDEPAAVQEVRNGRVHAMIAAQPLPAHMAADAPDLLISYNQQLMKEPIAFGLRKSDFDTMNFFNNWIEITKSKGWIEERYSYWFLSRDWKYMVK